MRLKTTGEKSNYHGGIGIPERPQGVRICRENPWYNAVQRNGYTSEVSSRIISGIKNYSGHEGVWGNRHRERVFQKSRKPQTSQVASESVFLQAMLYHYFMVSIVAFGVAGIPIIDRAHSFISFQQNGRGGTPENGSRKTSGEYGPDLLIHFLRDHGKAFHGVILFFGERFTRELEAVCSFWFFLNFEAGKGKRTKKERGYSSLSLSYRQKKGGFTPSFFKTGTIRMYCRNRHLHPPRRPSYLTFRSHRRKSMVIWYEGLIFP